MPVPLIVAPVTASPSTFLDRDRLARNHGFVDRRAALDHDTIDRDLVAGPDTQPVADFDVFKRNFFLGSTLADDTGSLGGEVEQCPDCTAGAFARAKLHELSEENENHNHGACFEVHADIPLASRKPAGNIPGARQQRH